MAASYPSALPTKSAAGANLSTNPHSALHDDLADEVVAIGTELGTNPKGTSASVKARLDTIQTKVDGIVIGTTSGTTTAAGDITITFGVTYTGSPAVVISVTLLSEQQVSSHMPASATTTTQVVRVTRNDAVLASTPVTIRWVAFGVIA